MFNQMWFRNDDAHIWTYDLKKKCISHIEQLEYMY